MNVKNEDSPTVPPDPTFTPDACAQVAGFLEGAIVVFFVIFIVGFVDLLYQNWSRAIGDVIHMDPRSVYWTPEQYFSHLFSFDPRAVILLGVAVMVAAVVIRSGYCARDLYRGREWVLGSLTIAIIAIIGIAFFLARYH